MGSIKLLLVASIAFIVVCVIGIFIAAYDENNRKAAVITAICTFIGAFITFISIKVPAPEIFLSKEQDESDMQIIEMSSIDNIKIYYTLDGTNPNKGNEYKEPIKIDKDTTVSAKTKYIFLWSDETTKNFIIEQKKEENTPRDDDKSNEKFSDSADTPSTENLPEDKNEDNGEDDKIEITEHHTPDDSVTSVSCNEWNADEDIGIDGNMYSGGLKITISNMFSSMGSGVENTVVSRISFPTVDDEDPRFVGEIVLDQSMFGSDSYATITISANGEEFSTGRIDKDTLESIPFDIDYSNADSIIIETEACLVGSDFVFGIVDPKD